MDQLAQSSYSADISFAHGSRLKLEPDVNVETPIPPDFEFVHVKVDIPPLVPFSRPTELRRPSSAYKRHSDPAIRPVRVKCDENDSKTVTSSNSEDARLPASLSEPHVRRLSREETRPSDKQYKCEICKAVYYRKHNMERHKATHQRESYYECDICNVRFSVEGKLFRHKMIHSRQKIYSYDVSHGNYTLKHVLTEETKGVVDENDSETVTSGNSEDASEPRVRRLSRDDRSTAREETRPSDKQYKCEICKALYSRKHNMERHKATHQRESYYECDICKVRFSVEGNLFRHKMIHSRQKIYSYDICQGNYTLKHVLTEETKVAVVGTNPYTCYVCKERFVYKGDLEEHTRTHAKVKSYTCKVCGESFPRMLSFKKHARTHAEVKSYACKVCGESFPRMLSFKKHARTHTGDAVYDCDSCRASFFQRGRLTLHKKKTHAR